MIGSKAAKRWLMCATAAIAAMTFAARAQTAPPPDATSPMAELPGLGVEWPDLNAADQAGPAQPAGNAPPAATDQRYSVVVSGIGALPPVVGERFDALSVLRQGEGKPANAAQLARRARDDAQLLDTILRAQGYFDADVTTDISARDGRLVVTLTTDPGPIYRFGSVTAPGLGSAAGGGLAIKPSDAVNADTVIAAEQDIRLKLLNQGYPFAKVTEPDIVVDHETREATLSLSVDPGGKRDFGAIRVTNADAPFGPRHVQTIARFRPGQTYDQSLVDDLKRAIIATGLASTVRVEPLESSAPGTVDMATTIEPAPPRTVAGEIGYGTGEGFKVQASWQHRNLIRPEGAITFRGIAGTQEQSLGALLRMSNFRRRDQVLNASVVGAHERRAAYTATSFEIGANIERQTNIIWQKLWTYSLGFELLASDERDLDASRGVTQRNTYLIGALPATLGYDGSDDLLDPTRGFRLSARVSPELSFRGRAFGYVRTQIDGSAYYPVNDQLVIAGRARVGATVGAAREDIAPSRRYYAGGGGSVRGFGYQEIGARNALNQPVGGRSLAEFSLEARVRLPVFGGNFGLVPFVDAGNVYTASFPTFSGLRIGAGLGLRYYSTFGPIRIDVGTPLARRPGESPIAVQVSLGQAF